MQEVSFVSAGIGTAKVSLSDLNLPGFTLDSDGTTVAYQAGAGFSHDLNYELALDFKYRYCEALGLIPLRLRRYLLKTLVINTPPLGAGKFIFSGRSAN